MLEYQNVKTFLQNTIFQICLNKFLLVKKLETPDRDHMSSMIFKAKKLLEAFMKKNCKKTIRKDLGLKK